MQNSLLDFSKFYCPYHPNELVTNFCTKSECLIGLCSHCVCDHTQMHTKMNTNPKYQSIKECHEKTQGELKDIILQLHECQQRVMNIGQSMKGRRKELKELVQKTKKSVIERIEASFKEVLQKIQSSIIEEQKVTGFHTSYKMELISNQVSRQINEITQYSRDLNSIHFLTTVKKLQIEDLSYFKTHCNQINQQIRSNQLFEPSIIFQKQKINDIENLVKKIFVLTFTYPAKHVKTQNATKIQKTIQNFTSPVKVIPVPQQKVIHERRLTTNNCNFSSVPQKQIFSKTMQAFRPSDTVFMSTVQNTSTLKNRNLSQNIKFENDGSEFKKNRGSKLSLTRALSRAQEHSKLKVQEQNLSQSLFISNIR